MALSKEHLKEEMEIRLFELKQAKKKLERRLTGYPEGKLHTTRNKNTWQYRVAKEENPAERVYLSKKKEALIRTLAQKDYDILALREINEEIEVLQKCLLKYHPHQLDSLYEESNEGRRKYLKPLYEPDELFDKKWLEKEYYHMEFSEDAPEYYTQQGERVRSKSEMIIADRLCSKGIPYRYEYPLNLQDGYTVHTDFYCLQRGTRKEIPWEHFGMMDQEEYVITAVKKIESYAKTGYILGRNFLATFETAYSPLNVKTVDAIIEQVLL